MLANILCFIHLLINYNVRIFGDMFIFNVQLLFLLLPLIIVAIM